MGFQDLKYLDIVKFLLSEVGVPDCLHSRSKKCTSSVSDSLPFDNRSAIPLSVMAIKAHEFIVKENLGDGRILGG